MSVKSEEPIDELTVQVCLLYHHSNFKYYTLFERGMELRTDSQIDGQTDDPITRCPWRIFQAGSLKTQRGLHGASATDVACQQMILTLDTLFRLFQNCTVPICWYRGSHFVFVMFVVIVCALKFRPPSVLHFFTLA